VPVFQALRDRWTPVAGEEVAIQEEISDAQALVDGADEGIDDFSGRLSKAIQVITKDDTSHALYVFHFGGKTLSEFRTPKLSSQLQAMKSWVEPLQKSPHPSLLAMAPELVTLLAKADLAVAAKEKAYQHRREFRNVGARRQFVDDLNAARAQAYGDLAKMPFLVLGLPPDYAERFFTRPGADEKAEEEEDTIASVTARIAAQEKALAADRELLVKLQAAAEDERKAAEQRKQDEAALAALQDRKEELRREEEALLARLGKS
jgi:hypothetical protein